MATYNLPRFMSRQEWEALSPDNLYWLKNSAKWAKFYPGDYGSNWQENWVMMNFSHPENVFKHGQESIYVYGKRINSDYRKMYGVT